MTFDELYPDSKYDDEIQFDGSFLIRDKEKHSCWNCGSLTYWCDGLFLAYLCSSECERQKWEEYFKASSK